jgi:primosomal protein N' (replication factor Y) (superfamily II helicase)
MRQMPAVAKVIVDIALDKEFDYAVPSNLEATIKVGSRVLVPFGKSKTAGYVSAFLDKSERTDLKPISSVVGDKPFVDEKMLELVHWMADYYCAPVEHAIRTVLPGPVREKNARFKQQLLVTLPDSAALPEIIGKLSPKQLAAVRLLQLKGSMFLHELAREAGITIAPIRSLERKKLVRIEAASMQRDPLARRNILPTQHLQLMPEQASALATVVSCMDAPPHVAGTRQSRTVLLYGVTGSGKTEVYLQAIDYALSKGKDAIVLVPEISLTPQTVERFAGRFGDRIAVLHSHLSSGERHDEWHRIHDGKAKIAIGARSAVFAPFRNLGLICVDEEHESTYKQEESPRYNARDVAVMRGRMENCAVVLGSATPCIESWHNVKTGKYLLSVLSKRTDNRKMPIMRIVDMRVETMRTGKPSVFSRDLIEAIRLRLEKAEQVILFLNRRGFATSLMCPKCGYVANCDMCSVAYTYHRTVEALHCHICGARKQVPRVCPGCKDPAFRFAGMGTQRVEDIIKKFFPHAKIQRMDADVTTRKDSYARILGDFRTGKTNILIGTQMIAKGLHFPNVTLVGVVYADLSLHMPDFRAGERTFQLLAQVAGRAGRGDVPGEVIVQTYTPSNPAIQAARRLDFEGFCDQEMEFRKELKYPPYAHLTCLTIRAASNEKAAFYSAALAKKIKEEIGAKAIVSDAAPAPLAKAKGLYRYQIMIRSAAMRSVTASLKKILADFKLPKDISSSLDVDAMSLL